MTADVSDEGFERASTSFLDWLQQNGTTISNKIELVDLRHQQAGRGVVAQANIDEDEELFSIPNSSILTSLTTELPSSAKQDLDDPWLALILSMVFEFQQGTKSRWKPYFDILPDRFDALMLWSQAELRALQGSAVVDKIGKKSADDLFTTQLIPIIRRHDANFHASDLTDDQLLALSHRMGSTIMAYAFDLADPSTSTVPGSKEDDGWEEDVSDTGDMLPKGMVPLADMLNADASRNNARLFYEDDRVVMKAITSIASGSEIFNDYGALPRADLLRRYGYVTDNYAPYDVVEVSLDLIKGTAKQSGLLKEQDIDARLAYFDTCVGLDDGYDIYRRGSEDAQFSDEFSALLNCLCLSTAEFDKLQTREKEPKSVLSVGAAQLLYDILVQRGTMYSHENNVEVHQTENGEQTENSEDQSIRRLHMARSVVDGERQVLNEAVTTIVELLNDGKKRKAYDFQADILNARSTTKRHKQDEVP